MSTNGTRLTRGQGWVLALRLFRSRPIAAGNAATFSVFALLMAMVFFMAQFLETGWATGRSVPGCGCCPDGPR